MNDLSIINRAINNVMNKYITENGFEDYVLFECKIMTLNSAVMFTMMIKEGLFRVEPFKAVFPASFLTMCEEDEVVKMVCDMFIGVINQCEKLAKKEEWEEKITFAK